MQRSLARRAVFEGHGLHGGIPVRLEVHPAPADHGIRFRRTDAGAQGEIIPALWNRVERTALNTRLVGAGGDSVATIEHLMAALAGMGIHNARVDLDGPEVPILDGSAAPFVRGLMAAGTRACARPLRVLQVTRPVEVRNGAAWARLDPARAFEMRFEIAFAEAAIGTQARDMSLSNGAFLRTLSDSRTFCRAADIEDMRARGLALGGSLANAVVVEGDRVLTPGGLRHADEPVRHKMLDALGDLALAGAPILGRYTGHRAGHALTNTLLRTLFDTPAAWRRCLPDADQAARLPGVGISMRDLAFCA